MKNSITVKITLILSGLIALGVGGSILFIPDAFHASAGLVLGDDVNLLNEMRAPAGMLLAAGFYILAGAFRASLAFSAMVVSSTLYLGYGFARVVSVIFDGVPSGAMLQIMALELVIGAICAVMLKRYRIEN